MGVVIVWFLFLPLFEYVAVFTVGAFPIRVLESVIWRYHFSIADPHSSIVHALAFWFSWAILGTD